MDTTHWTNAWYWIRILHLKASSNGAFQEIGLENSHCESLWMSRKTFSRRIYFQFTMILSATNSIFFKYTVKCFIRIFPVVNIVVLKVIFIGCTKKRCFGTFEFKNRNQIKYLVKNLFLSILQNDKCWWTSEIFSYQFDTLYSIISIWSKTFDTGATVISLKWKKNLHLNRMKLLIFECLP